MLLRIETTSHLATRVTGERLKEFGLNERGLQDVFFRSLDRLLPDEELLLIAQSRNWQEEPDLLALDQCGRLYIFEIRVWESRSENLLQALRYGQLFGAYDYGELDQLFRRFDETGRSLAEAHRAAFGVTLAYTEFNRKQVFVILTNGLDFRTRQAAQYWRSSGLDVRHISRPGNTRSSASRRATPYFSINRRSAWWRWGAPLASWRRRRTTGIQSARMRNTSDSWRGFMASTRPSLRRRSKK